MLIDFKNWNIILHLSQNEKYVNIQDNTSPFNLCFRLRDNYYQVPYIALPIVLQSCKKLNYKVSYTDNLLNVHKKIKEQRRLLEEIKNTPIEQIQKRPSFANIWSFLESFQSKGHLTLSDSQKRSIVYAIIGERILIANEIGTGKTLTINLACKYLIQFANVQKIVILVPASLVQNYFNDYVKFFGNSGIMTISKEAKPKRKELYKIFNSNKDINFLIINYEKCLYDYEELKNIKTDVLIVDEFHRMKNFLNAKRSINFFEMLKSNWNCKYRFPMSGTPIENKLFDLFPIFKLLDGGSILGGQRFFETNFVEYKKVWFKVWYQGRQITKCEEKPIGFKNLEFLKSCVRPLIIRERLSLPVGKYREFVEIEASKKIMDKYEEIKLTGENASQKYQSCRQFLCNTEREGISENPKLEELQNILDQTSEKVIIFSFYLTSMEILSKYLKEKNIGFLEISGNTKEDPTKTIEKFSIDPNIKCLICTDKINFGHNITCARIVVEWDLSFKPSLSNQRIGRAYRTGQTGNVFVYSFVIKGTVEEKIYKEYKMKEYLIEQAIEQLDDKKLQEVEKEIENNVMKEFN